MTATRLMLSPVMLLAIALLIINDQFLKQAMPGVLTGKLSDVAGLIFFPILLVAALEHIKVRTSHRTVAFAAIATGVVFASIKTLPFAGDVYRVGLAALQWPFRALLAVVAGDAVPGLHRVQLTQDPTDLIALPALLVPVWLAKRVMDRALRGSVEVAARRS
ncbi:MAG: hypothetical protein ACKV2T_35850 [Kofleriaceae bacterium]